MYAFVRILWFLLAVCLTATPAAAERRMALVIGNGNYLHELGLRNPGNDAADMEAMLAGLGFEVMRGVDLDFQAMSLKIGEFLEKIDNVDVAVFHYSGHGMQINGENYLAPVSLRASSEAMVEINSVGVTKIFNQMRAKAKVALLFLDACRDNKFLGDPNNPNKSFNSSRGLTVIANSSRIERQIDAPNGTLIGYATEPGNVASDGSGRNSPYTAALLRRLPAPGEDIEFVMRRVREDVMRETANKQSPRHDPSFSSRGFSLSGGLPPGGEIQLQPSPQTSGICSPASEDIKLWQLFQSQNAPEAYEKYLSLCPKGLYVAEARRKIEELRSIPDWYLLLYADLDFWGGDTTPKGIEMETAERCAQHCAADTGCKLFSYNSEKRQCYPKNRLDLPVVFPGVLSGVFQKRDPGATGAPEAKSIVARFVAYPNKEHAGPINSKWQKRIGSIDGCLRICDRDKDCVAATWGDRQPNGSRCAMRFIGILKDMFGRSDDFGSTAFDKKTVLVQPAKDPVPLPGLNLAKQ